MEAVILVNKGGGSAGDDARQRVGEALRSAGIAGKVELLDGDDIAKRAAKAVKASAPLVIAAGGDGTMSAAAGALAGSKTALGLLPLGTLNHLARDLDIPFDLDQAAAIIAEGNKRIIDVARLGDRVFVNNSALGLYPLMVADREGQQDKLGRSKKLAMLVAGTRTLVRYHHHRLTLTVNDAKTKSVDTPLLFIGNNEYRLEMPRAGCRDRLDDGRLSVVVMRKQGRLALLAAMVRALAGRSRASDLTELDDVTHLKVDSRRSKLTIAIDGETIDLKPPLDYRIEPQALTVIAPADSGLRG